VSGAPVDLRNESRQVREALSALGRLLGAALIDPPRDLASFVAEHLATSKAGVSVVTSVLRGVDAALVHVAVARLLESASDAVLTDDLGNGSPGFELVTVDVDVQVAARTIWPRSCQPARRSSSTRCLCSPGRTSGSRLRCTSAARRPAGPGGSQRAARPRADERELLSG